MNLSNIFKRFFRRKADVITNAQDMPSNGHLTGLIQMLEKTEVEEYSCDDVYKLIDEFTEMVARGEDARQIMPLVSQHIDLCPDCREEYEALLRILENKN